MEELLGRKIPWSAEAEQSVIGSCLIRPNCMTELLDKLHAEDFYMQQNREIFETLTSMFTFGKVIDPVTLVDEMKVRDVYHEESTSAYIRELLNVTPTSANVMKYASIVRDKALLRNIVLACEDTAEVASADHGDAEEVLELAEKRIYALREGRDLRGLVHVSQTVENVFNEISARNASGNAIPGISTGFADIDRRLLGLNNGNFVVVAARPGMGKTSMALNMALHAAKESKKAVAIFSLEMSREELVTRLISSEGLIQLQSLLTGNLSADEWRKAAAASSALGKLDILVNDNPTLTVSEMNAQCRQVHNLGLVVIDYLQLMQSSGSGNRWAGESRTQAVSDISRMLKIMAKELNVPVLCVSQLSRANEGRQDKRPMMSDIRESGAIEQDADVILGIYREGYYSNECENPNVAECIVLKNRHGETGTDYLVWQGEYTSFRNSETRYDE